MQRKTIVTSIKWSIFAAMALAICIPIARMMYVDFTVNAKPTDVILTVVHKHIDQSHYGTYHYLTFTSDKWGSRYEMLVTAEYYSSAVVGDTRRDTMRKMDFTREARSTMVFSYLILIIGCAILVIGMGIGVYRFYKWGDKVVERWIEGDPQ